MGLIQSQEFELLRSVAPTERVPVTGAFVKP